MELHFVDYTVLALYFAFVIGIGYLLKKQVSSSADYLTSNRSVPLWITSLAFVATNLGAQELVGMCASGAKYGIMTAHFYWVGAIPAMLFVGLFMMPFYYGSKARSVPEYLKLRYDEKTRAFNAFAFRGDDDLLLRHLDVRLRHSVPAGLWLGLLGEHLHLGG